MQWWQLWDRISLATHGMSKVGDHEITAWASMAFLAGVAVAVFVLAWAVLRRPTGKLPARTVCTSARESSSDPVAAAECADTNA